jgi:hypothetical protein
MSEHEVGYGKPPKEHQFKKGQPAANPKGRPKGRKSKSILDKLDEKVVVGTKKGRRVKKTLREVLDHSVVKDAIAGDKHARSLIYRYREAAEKVDVTPKSVAVENDQQTPLEGPQPPYTIPATPEERRQAFKTILEKALPKTYQSIEEALDLGIFENDGLRLELAPWARHAAGERCILSQSAPSDGALPSAVGR